MKDHYYFDNAATTWPKPECVYQYMDSFYRGYGVNPGRAGHEMAVEAERIALVNAVAPAEELRERALEIAQAIASNGPIAIRAAKAAIDGGCEMPLAEGLEHEARCYERVLGTQDRLEALAAFAEKRKPDFTDS